MDSIPLDLEEREWLITHLTEVIGAAGWQRFVSAPLVLPNERSFPDPWTADARSVRRLALRLLAYVGLDELGVQVEVFDAAREASDENHDVAAWFAGIDDEVCWFGCARSQLEDPIAVVGAMAHEVAHAYRRFHAIEVEDRELEERLTDMTTILLGFGVLTTNASLRHRSRAIAGSSMLGGLEWSRAQLGYLPPAAMSFLLAIWWSVRGNEERGRKAIARDLELNQRGWFRAGLRVVAARQGDLRFELGIPGPERWPAREDVETLASGFGDWVPEDEDEWIDDGDEDDDDPDAGSAVVFRVRRRLPWLQPDKYKLEILIVVFGWIAALVGGAGAWGLIASAAAIVIAVGRSRWQELCSNPECERVLADGVEGCPGCGAEVAGSIDEPADRLEAEDRLELARGK